MIVAVAALTLAGCELTRPEISFQYNTGNVLCSRGESRFKIDAGILKDIVTNFPDILQSNSLADVFAEEVRADAAARLIDKCRELLR